MLIKARCAGQRGIRAAWPGCALLGLCLLSALPAASAAQKKPAAAEPAADVAALAAEARKSVAIVRHYGRDGRQDGVGAGVIVGRDGLVATCFHVIGEARPVSVELSDGRRFDVVEVFASDRKLDLAVVRIAVSNLPALKLGDSAALKQGAAVIAIGNPLGLEHSVVQGVVSAKRDFDGVEMIQLAIPIESGNSGGPLLDTKGRVQGLLSMKSAVTANLGFAVPVNELKSLLERPNPVQMSGWLKLGALDTKLWEPLMGARWSRKAGRVLVEGLGDGFGGRSLCLARQAVPAMPYEISVTVKLDDESGAAGLAFASDAGDRHYGFYPTAGQFRLTRFDGPNVFSWNILSEFKTPHYKPGDWNTIAVRIETNRITGFVNGELVMESPDAEWREGRVGLAKFRETKAQFRDFRVGTNLIAVRRGTDSSDERGQLMERARKLEKEAAELRRAASVVHAKRTGTALVEALRGPEEKIDLFHGALLVARLDNPDLDLDSYRAELAVLGAELKSRLADAAAETAKVATLTRFLFQEQGFHGSRNDYHNRANSYVSDVLDDREGLPITLAVIYLELARQIGLTNVVGLPVPTHFMVSYRPAHGVEQIIDVFNGGKTLTRSDAVELVADGAERITDDDFKPARKREIITRMLRNLHGVAQRGGTPEEAVRYLDVIVALNPDSAFDRLARARAHMQRSDNAAAREDLRWLLDHAPEGMDLERLAELYRSL